MNKRGFLATLAAMCVAPVAAKAEPNKNIERVRVLLEVIAEQDRAAIHRIIDWEAGGLIHVTAVGRHYLTDDSCKAWTFTLSWPSIDKQGKSGA